MIETDLLVVGAGPAGSALASLLARYNLKGIMISSASSTAAEPRAHLTNMSALEAMRDLGLEDDCLRLGKRGEHIQHYRWCETMKGPEYARIYSWGNDPKRMGDYAVASPTGGCMDLPQTLLEPLLVKYATTNGFEVRFSTQLVSFAREKASGRYISVVRDRLLGIQFCIASKFVFGADGGRSVVVKELGLPLDVAPQGGLAWNVHVRCDLEDLMKYQPGNLHWNLRLLRDDPWMINMRMVKPWFEWMMVAIPKNPFITNPEYTAEQWKEVLRDLIQDDAADIQVLGIAKWNINEVSVSFSVYCGEIFH